MPGCRNAGTPGRRWVDAGDSVDRLIEAIMAYIDRRNVDPKPFVWTASVQHILEKLAKARATLEALH